MIGWYARFIQDAAELKIPLCRLLRKNEPFVWTDEQEEAMKSLKKALCEAPVLARPDFSKDFTLHCDASDFAIGAVLTQEDDEGNEHPIMFFSQALTPAERQYSVTERECLAVVRGIKKSRPYIEGGFVTVITDHHSLKWLLQIKEPEGRLCRWALKLQHVNMKIVHRKGKFNVVPDALSRINHDLMAGIQEISDTWYLQRIADIRSDPAKFPDWRVDNGLIYVHKRDYLSDPVTNNEYDWKLVVPKDWQPRVLRENHCETWTGHFGYERTYDRLKRDYYWIGMAYDTRDFVGSCVLCQKYKPVQTGQLGLMTKRHIDTPWQVVSADVMEFPKSKHGHKYLLVFQDLFTKWVEVYPMRNSNGQTIARAFEDLILFRWETPQFLLTDNGTEFENKSISKMLKDYGIRQISIMPYHAQANPTERVNRSLKPLIAMFVDKDHKTWDENLPEFRFALNTAASKTTKVSPTFLNFGRHPRLAKSLRQELEYDKSPDPPNLNVDTSLWSARLSRLDDLRDLVTRHIESAQATQKKYFDIGRRDLQFSEGDRVMRRTQPLSSAEKGFSAKLAPKFEDPVQVKENCQKSHMNCSQKRVVAFREPTFLT